MFVVLEGVDGSGKTAQAAMLHTFLQSKMPAVLLKYPDRKSLSGKVIAAHLSGASTAPSPMIATLLLAANIWEVAADAQRALEGGKAVVMDRYAATHHAYSVARGCDAGQATKLIDGIVQPTSTIFLDVAPNVALSRKQGKLEIYETPEFQNVVYETYQSIAKPEWIMVDASESADIVHQKILTALKLK